MNTARCFLSMVLAAALVGGCDDKKNQNVNANKPSSEPAAATGGGGTTGKAGDGVASGKAVFVGVAPKPLAIDMKASPQCAAMHNTPVYDEAIVVGANNELKNVVVYVKDGAKLGGAVPNTPVMLDQVGCIYTPHVVSVMVGQDFKVRNSDGFLHNVHGLCRENPEFNFPQQQKGQVTKIEANQAVETYKIKCDVHPWMNTWVVVLDHPYSAVTDENGAFAIKGLGDGKYTLVAWHQKLGTKEAEVEVKGGKATVEFKFEGKK